MITLLKKLRRKVPQTYKDILETEVGPNEGVMAFMDETGDQKVTWNRDNDEEVDRTRKLFDEWKKKRYMAYKVKRDGTKGEVITAFDSEAEAIIFAPPLQGG